MDYPTEIETPSNGEIEHPKQKRSFFQVLPLLGLIIIGVVVGWLVYRVDVLEKRITRESETLSQKIVLITEEMASESEIVNQKITDLESIHTVDLNSIENWINDVVSAATSDISSLNSRVSYATSLAENANNYAHSHNTWSDARLKENFRPLENPLGKLLDLHGVTYNWTSEAQSELGLSSQPELGLIAQEVERVFPELVTVDPSGYRQVDYARLTVVLLEALREQQSQIDNFESRLVELETGSR